MKTAATRQSVLSALASFDAETTGSGPRFRGRHKYALRHDEKLYPVKEIISRATGVARSKFSGGKAANELLRGLGFEVVEIPPPPK